MSQRMGKTKKPKKCISKVTVGQTVKGSVGTSNYGTTLSKPVLTITGISKSGSAISLNGETKPESVGHNDLHVETDCIDHSLTREPINLGVKNVRQILTCIKDSTLEVKDLILNECNIIYECKICRNLFRSLANFIAHKRIYCKNHFCENMVLFDSTQFQFDQQEDHCEDIEVEDEEHEDLPEDEQLVSTNSNGVEFVSPVSSSATNSSTENLNPNKEKTFVQQKQTFIENCIKKAENDKQKQESNGFELRLTSIKTNPNAVFQKLQTNELNDNYKNKKQIITELFNDAKNSREMSDSQAIKRQRVEEILPRTDTETQVNESSVNETLNVKCELCDSTFTSTKTFKVHIRTIHSTNRLIYPCPLCSLTFKQLSNATRHIIQIHKRTKTQANTLREVMKRRAYSANSSENSSEVEDASDEEDIEEDLDKSVSRKGSDNKNKMNTIESNAISSTVGNDSLKPNERHPPRINAPCVYNCGNVFDWAPAKRSHEKSCRKRLENEKEIETNRVEINGSSHCLSSSLAKNYRLNSCSSSQTHTESNSNQEISIVPNHTSNSSTNIILPNSVEERIKEFADLKSLRCTHCPTQDFMNLNQLLQHAVTHIGYSIYRCHGCSYHSIYENDMKYHLMNNHNINEDMISKHYQTLPNLTQPRLLIVPMKSRKPVNTDLESPGKNSKLKIHLRTMGNTSKKCYEIVDK